jgi:hypothetical protein
VTRSRQRDGSDREAQKKDADARGTLLAGSRVLDRVTGLDGEILVRTAATPTPFGAFPVKLDSGDVVERFPRDLFARPTPPRA